ncbi:MAG: hypothetical protein HYW33_02050 [Candidatus Blackburnbacteria bacterium]|nr:hypothetical protein [Candidatus Blackburnbacteria bacterium]
MLGLIFSQNQSILTSSIQAADLKAKSRPFWLPLSVFLVVAVLSIVVVVPQVQEILNAKGRIFQLAQDNRMLLDKKNKLALLNKSLLAQQAHIAVSAIPIDNSGLSALGAVRSKAFSSNIAVNQIRVMELENSQKSHKEVELQIELNGSLSNILEFIDSLKGTAPIMRISSIKMVGDGVTLSADVGIKTFWAELPATLPPVKQPLDQINKKDQDILREMGSLKVEALGSVAPASASARENPFQP